MKDLNILNILDLEEFDKDEVLSKGNDLDQDNNSDVSNTDKKEIKEELKEKIDEIKEKIQSDEYKGISLIEKERDDKLEDTIEDKNEDVEIENNTKTEDLKNTIKNGILDLMKKVIFLKLETQSDINNDKDFVTTVNDLLENDENIQYNKTIENNISFESLIKFSLDELFNNLKNGDILLEFQKGNLSDLITKTQANISSSLSSVMDIFKMEMKRKEEEDNKIKATIDTISNIMSALKSQLTGLISF